MIWVGWRQQRTEALIAAAALAMLAAAAIPIGLHMASVYTHDGLSACSGVAQPGSVCGVDVPAFLARFNVLNLLFDWSTLLAPLTALLLAAPFALDLDDGTYRLFWTQSITRRRWIVTKLGMSVNGVVLVGFLLSVLASWLLGPIAHFNGRMGANTYDGEGIVPVAYALFTLGVAVALGALWRRAVPALLCAFVVYVVVRAFMDSWLRQHLVGSVTRTWPIGGGASGGPQLDHDLVINQFTSDKSGHPLLGLHGLCVRAAGGIVHRNVVGPCAPSLHGFMTATYIPASRFWDLQAIEFGIVAGIGAVLILAAAWWTHDRVA